MNITVINGTEKHGVTYRLKEMFLALLMSFGREILERRMMKELDLLYTTNVEADI